jgi:hypothetical protein
MTTPAIKDVMTHVVADPTPRRARCPVADAAIGVLDQCDRLLRELPDAAYAAPSRILPGGTIGKHTRHAIDHFAALLSGHEQRRTVDYDHRERGVPMETVRAEALAALRTLRQRLDALAAPEMNAPTRVRVMLTAEGADAELLSTLGRELAFAAHHAVHHHAMIKAIAAEHGHAAPADFGKAPSTLAHHSS